ncbi:response regulator transcription factor [Cuneatibacter sp. NSJ-177]|uniref:response regulator transcription factor n=1 Tax=Cuneatibacter sp. NSJ-177 TaxID=2931401 RepID=UPI001FD5303F|nr:response regulator transcription factor [Cuneatibacter sp. NSJ-177]MCJ7834454.1 response regulator transcription factor [Cuneatibacter sp. NSJ-177]
MKIIIIDDDPFVCASLKTILQADPEISVTATGTSGEEAVKLYREDPPDILLMDIQMKGITGLEAGEQILREDPQAKLLFLTTFSDDEYIRKALQLGAKGYLIKQDIEAIAPALKAVESGQNVFGTEIVTKLPSLIAGKPEFPEGNWELGPREREIIGLVAEGKNNREIADALFLSEGTVRNYLSALLDKLELRNRTELAIFYYQHLK